MDGRTLDFIALGVLVAVVLIILYGLLSIRDIPYHLAKTRSHPHQDAIYAAGWCSLFLLHTIWPLLWIWAMLYKPEIEWGDRSRRQEALGEELLEEVTVIKDRVFNLEQHRGTQQETYVKDISDLSLRVFELEKKLSKMKGE